MFPCGKLGHLSRECRSRIASEKQPTPQVQTSEVTTTPRGDTTGRSDRKPIICFNCQQKGHKSPQCPHKTNKVKRIQIPRHKIVQLKSNKLLGSIRGHSIPITCDSGADMTVVPEECVGDSDFTGDTCTIGTYNNVKTSGKRCNVSIRIQDRVLVREAVTQPGADLS